MAGAGAAGGAGTRAVTDEVRLFGGLSEHERRPSPGMDVRDDGAETAVRCPVSDPGDLVDPVPLAEALSRPVWGSTVTVRDTWTPGDRSPRTRTHRGMR